MSHLLSESPSMCGTEFAAQRHRIFTLLKVYETKAILKVVIPVTIAENAGVFVERANLSTNTFSHVANISNLKKKPSHLTSPKTSLLSNKERRTLQARVVGASSYPTFLPIITAIQMLEGLAYLCPPLQWSQCTHKHLCVRALAWLELQASRCESNQLCAIVI